MSWNGSPGTVEISNQVAHSGSHSLRFFFKGKASGSDATAEQRFDIGRNLREIWVEFYIYYPNGTEGLGARYYHRTDTGSNNNKFLRIWGDVYSASNEVGASTWPLDGGDSRLGFEYEKDEKPMGAYGSGGPNPFVHNGNRGRWTHVQFHARLGSGPEAFDGSMELWVDGAKTTALDNKSGKPGLDLYNSDAMNYFNEGYLLGWANSGFDKDTYIFIDDVRFYDANPGW